jgi:hypothetical protein
MTAKEKGQNANSDQQSNENVLGNSTTNGAKAQILLTKFASDKILTKTYSIEGKKSGGLMTTGSMQIEAIESLEGLAQLLTELKPVNALSFGIPKGQPVGESAPVTTKNFPREGHVSRTKDNFVWNDGAGIFMIDYDGDALDKAELVAAIRQAMPALKTVKMLWLPSSSSYIFNSQTQEYLSGLKGQRLYFVLDKANKIPDLAKRLHERLWLHGHGYIEISAAGNLLERSLMDRCVYQSQRLDFCGLAHCIKPIEKRKREPEIIDGNSDMLIFSDDVVQLNETEKQEYIKRLNTAKSVKEPEAREIKLKRIDADVYKLCQAKPDLDKNLIRKQVEQAYNGGDLTGEFQIFVVDNGIETAVSVSEILSNPGKYDKMTCLDPLEPEYRNRAVVGIIYADDNPLICSQAHGEHTFYLKSDIEENDTENQPICFDSHALKEFPAEIFPEVIRDYVLQIAQIRQVPVDMAAQIALSVLSTCLQKKFNVKVGKNSKQIEQLSLWTLTAMTPGNRKSDTLKDLTKVLTDFQLEEIERTAQEIKKSKHDHETWEMELRQLKQDKVKERDIAKKILIQQKIEKFLTEEPVELFEPLILSTSNVTPEGMTDRLVEQKERFSLLDTEGASLFEILAGRYNSSGADLDPFLNSFCGDTVASVRRGNGVKILKKPALAMGLMVQPSVLFKATGNPEFNNRGLIGRFLCSIPHSLIGYRDLQTEVSSDHEQQNYELLIRSLLNLPLPESETELLIDGEAFKFYEEHVYNPLEIGQRRGGEYERIQAWASKFAGTVARIAALFHIANDPTVSDTRISLDDVKKASQLIPYYAQHTKAALRMISGSGEPTDAEKVLSWAYDAGKMEGFTLNEYFKAHKSLARTSDELMPIFNTLTNRKILFDRPELRQKSKGRKPEHYFIPNVKCIRCQKCFAPPQK